jgi:hypothetical protein
VLRSDRKLHPTNESSRAWENYKRDKDQKIDGKTSTLRFIQLRSLSITIYNLELHPAASESS